MLNFDVIEILLKIILRKSLNFLFRISNLNYNLTLNQSLLFINHTNSFQHYILLYTVCLKNDNLVMRFDLQCQQIF